MFQLATAPQSIGEVLDSTFKLYKHSFGKLLGLILIYAILANVPSIISAFTGGNMGMMSMAGLISLIPVMIVCGILYAALLYKTNALAINDSDAAERSVQVGVRKLLPLIGLGILYMLAILLGSVLLIIPGIILMLSLAMSIPLLVIDDEGVIESLKHSHRMVWGNWWRVAVIFTVVMILYMVPSALVGGVAGFMLAAGGAVDGAAMELAFTALTVVVQIIFMPLMFASTITVFHDLKSRKEGVDLEARLAEA